MSAQQIEALLSGDDGRGGRTGLRDEKYRWTDNIVPYIIREEDFSKILVLLSLPFQSSLLISLNTQLVLKSIIFISVLKDSTRYHV